MIYIFAFHAANRIIVTKFCFDEQFDEPVFYLLYGGKNQISLKLYSKTYSDVPSNWDFFYPKNKMKAVFVATILHRAMNKLGAIYFNFISWLMVKNMPAVYSADRCNFWESATDCYRNTKNLYKSWVERALGPIGHFRFVNHHCNWWNSLADNDCPDSGCL